MSEDSDKLLWKPTQQQIMSSNLQQFMNSISKIYSVRFSDYDEFQKWSVDNPENFWSAVWTYTGIKSSVYLTRPLIAKIGTSVEAASTKVVAGQSKMTT